jgi:NitT/TauT family transport system substrate-binding protein
MGKRRGLLGFGIIILSIVLFNSILIGELSTAQAAPAVKPEMTKLTVGLAVPAFCFLPIWVADQKGFLKEEGFTDVKILAFGGDADVMQALAAGSVDINMASLTGLVSSITSGQKFKAVWGGYNMAQFEWYAQPKYKSISETKGARYGISKFGAMTDFLTRFALRKAGIDPEKDVSILQIGPDAQNLAALVSGLIDVSILSIPLSYMAAEKGMVKLMSQKDNIALDYPTEIVYAKEEFIAKNPNTIKAFLRGTGKAIEWIKAKPEGAADVASRQLKLNLEYCAKGVNAFRDGWFSDGRLAQAQEGMKVFWTIAVEVGDVKEPWPYNKWLDETFLKTQDQWRK